MVGSTILSLSVELSVCFLTPLIDSFLKIFRSVSNELMKVVELSSRTEEKALQVLQTLSSVICSLDGGDFINKGWLENVSEH